MFTTEGKICNLEHILVTLGEMEDVEDIACQVTKSLEKERGKLVTKSIILNIVNENDIKISKAEMKDACEMAQLEWLCFGNKMFNWDLSRWKLLIGKQTVYKATINDRIIGGTASCPTSRKTWFMDSLFVHPDYRCLGIGRKLREKGIAEAWLKPIETMVNIKNPWLESFYKSFGFKRKNNTPSDYFYDGEKYYSMIKD